MRRVLRRCLTALIVGLLCSPSRAEREKIRVGFFPNMTHAQVLLGLENGTFQKALGPDVEIVSKAFNAGPSAVEALFARAIDLAYLGPGPAINGFVRSEGALRIVAGSCSGGASLVARNGVRLDSPQDLRGKKLATPQLANTQDLAARRYLKAHGLAPVENGGDVQILPIANPDQLTLFKRGHLDAAWAPEPWATRLVQEAGGHIVLDERSLWPGHEFAATLVVVRQDYLLQHPDRVAKWIRAHEELTRWIRQHPDQARLIVGREIERLTTKALPDSILAAAWRRLDFTTDPLARSVETMAQSAYSLGFLGRREPDLRNLFDLRFLPPSASPPKPSR